MQTYELPPIRGTSEIHIFLEPIDPSQELVQRAQQLTVKYNEYNEMHGTSSGHPMKMCHLALEYVSGKHSVLQSARYICAETTEEARQQAEKDAEWFRQGGFKVLRVKIEALASTEGVPANRAEALLYPHLYFEHHIRVAKTSDADSGGPPLAIGPDELELLKTISADMSKRFDRPVPLSYIETNDRQRYLNVRFSGVGSDEARLRTKAIEEAIEQQPSLRRVKTISEYVWHDTNRVVDANWIDFETDG
ncbi:Hypothetical protein UVM_LOCUS34 [uncultured virus]|nr:Hypothetical protein UVM_LOCUS34 [uncultured virus]